MNDVRFNLSLTLDQAKAVKEAVDDYKNETNSSDGPYSKWIVTQLEAVLVKLDDLGVD